MNDSFLEDLELVSSDVKNVNAHSVDRHVTTRTATSSPLQHISKNKRENVKLNQKVEHSALPEKSALKETKDLKTSQQDIRKQQMKVRIVDSKLKSIENKVKNDEKEKEIKDDTKAKIRESKIKSTENKAIIKDRTRRSGSHKENTQTSGIKENNRPGSSKGETTPTEAITKKQTEKTEAYEIHEDVKSENTDFAMLNAIKEIVNMHMKQESSKILRVLQSLHYKSQATVIKHLLFQTDDIIAELRSSNDSSRMRSLTELNEKLQENNITLQKRNEELQKQLGELEHLKQENIALKLKCEELSKQ